MYLLLLLSILLMIINEAIISHYGCLLVCNYVYNLFTTVYCLCLLLLIVVYNFLSVSISLVINFIRLKTCLLLLIIG